MIGQVVVIFHRLESVRFTEKTEVVHGNWVREKSLYRFEHTKAGAKDRNDCDIRSHGFGRVFVVEGAFSLWR